MKVYIASPFFNEVQLSVVQRIESELEYFKIDYFSPRKEGVIKEMTPEEKKKNAKSLYDSNIANIYGCDAMIVVVDDKDTGTLFELGFAACLKDQRFNTKRRIITFTMMDKPVNLMLKYCVDVHCKGFLELGKVLNFFKENKEFNDQDYTAEINE